MALPPPPAFRVNLNNNVVDGTKMLGGYTSWQLWPNGTKISPVTGKSSAYTVSNANTLYFFSAAGSWDAFYTTNNADFLRDEVVQISGPIAPPGGGGLGAINMQGMTSTIVIVWQYAGSANN